MKYIILTIALLFGINFFAKAGEYNAKNINSMFANKSFNKRLVYIVKELSGAQFGELSITSDELIENINNSVYQTSNCSKNSICLDLKVIKNFQQLMIKALEKNIEQVDATVNATALSISIAKLGKDLPWNLFQKSCADNLKNNKDSYSYRIYADDFGKDDFRSDDEWYLADFKQKAIKSIEHVYAFSACDIAKTEMKINCQESFIEYYKNYKTADYICKAETKEGFIFVTEDMLGYMNIIFNRWD